MASALAVLFGSYMAICTGVCTVWLIKRLFRRKKKPGSLLLEAMRKDWEEKAYRSGSVMLLPTATVSERPTPKPRLPAHDADEWKPGGPIPKARWYYEDVQDCEHDWEEIRAAGRAICYRFCNKCGRDDTRGSWQPTS